MVAVQHYTTRTDWCISLPGNILSLLTHLNLDTTTPAPTDSEAVFNEALFHSSSLVVQ